MLVASAQQFPTKCLERRLLILKELGVNAIRTSRNPPAPELLDMCDRLGLLVKDEAFDEFTPAKNKWVTGRNNGQASHFGYGESFSDWSVTDVSDMVRRDRNHPSIISWSIGNEIDYPNDPFLIRPRRNYRPQNPPAGNLVTCGRPLVDAVRSGIPRVRSPPRSRACNVRRRRPGRDPRHRRLQLPGTAIRRPSRGYPKRLIFGSENNHQVTHWTSSATSRMSLVNFSGLGLIISAKPERSRTAQRSRPSGSFRFQEAEGLVPPEPLERRADGVSCGVSHAAASSGRRRLDRTDVPSGSKNTGTGRPDRRLPSRPTRMLKGSR